MPTKIPALLAVATAAATLVTVPALAAPPSPALGPVGYVVDASSGFVTNASGQCWRTGSWTPAQAMEPCDAVIRPAAVVPPAPPEQVAQAPAPAPMPVPVPPGPVTQTLRFSGDVLFGFDKATLQPDGKTLLNDLVRDLQGANYEKVIITGHTDRIGSAAYNQKLSVQRAETVRDYLMGQNVGSNVIEAKGLGETQPSGDTKDCKGKGAKIIACLQPDRRVEVEMQGSKTTQPAAN